MLHRQCDHCTDLKAVHLDPVVYGRVMTCATARPIAPWCVAWRGRGLPQRYRSGACALPLHLILGLTHLPSSTTPAKHCPSASEVKNALLPQGSPCVVPLHCLQHRSFSTQSHAWLPWVRFDAQAKGRSTYPPVIFAACCMKEPDIDPPRP